MILGLGCRETDRQAANGPGLRIFMQQGSSDDVLSAVATEALNFVRSGQTVGLGNGRATTVFIRILANSGLKVRAVAASTASEAVARELGIEILNLANVNSIDISFDDADEVDPRLNLIKGSSGALVREKVLAGASRRRLILVEEEKNVAQLGQRGILPIEVVPSALALCQRHIKKLGFEPYIRCNSDGRQFRSDDGNVMLDCRVRTIPYPAVYDRYLRDIPGIVASGLFIGMTDVVLVGESNGKVRTLKPHRRPSFRWS